MDEDPSAVVDPKRTELVPLAETRCEGASQHALAPASNGPPRRRYRPAVTRHARTPAGSTGTAQVKPVCDFAAPSQAADSSREQLGGAGVRSRSMPELRGDHAIKNDAIALERKAGREPEDGARR